MMRRIVTTLALALIALGASAQEDALFPGAPVKPVPSAAVKQDDPRVRVNFTKGDGAAIDTLDIGDDRVKVVLCDNGSWYFIKDLDRLAADDVFSSHWEENSLAAYKDVQLSSLPTHNTIILADSVSKWVCPYQTKVFSKFGYRHRRRHQGVDLPYPHGTPVKAAFDGRVRTSMYTKGYGNLVIIRHENGLETYYGHLSKRQVEAGEWVHAGDVIGLGGSTGRSSGPHLHFETRYRGFAFDPEWIADFETGRLRRNVFVLRRSYLSPSSHYIPESIDEEEEVYLSDEEIAKEEERIEAERAAMKFHTVRKGETVSGIALKYGKNLNQIKKLNPKLNVNKISIGQKIRVN